MDLPNKAKFHFTYSQTEEDPRVNGDEGCRARGRLFLLRPRTWTEGDEEDDEGVAMVDLSLLDTLVSFFFSFSASHDLSWLTLLFPNLVAFIVAGSTQLHMKPENLPIRARRLTQLGIGFPVNLIQVSSQKWLQFLVIRL